MKSVFVSVATIIALAGCSGSSDGPAASEKPPVAVEVVNVVPADVEERIAVVGTLASKFKGTVKAEYSGMVTEVFVSEWVPVKEGELLARFDRREPEASLKSATAAVLQADVGATRATRELERFEKLRTSGLATQQSLDDARTAAAAAEAQLEAARAQEEMARTRLAKTDIRAPMTGVVSARNVNPGDFIENMGSPAPMFEIVDNEKLELEVSVPSSRIGAVRLGQQLRFTVDAVPGRVFTGEVSHINPAADLASRTVGVMASVANPDAVLKTGLFAEGEIVTGRQEGVLSIPRTAMLSWDPSGGAAVVFLVSGDRAVRREVRIGAASGDAVEVTDGLAAGDVVVVRGGFNLHDGDRVVRADAAGA